MVSHISKDCTPLEESQGSSSGLKSPFPHVKDHHYQEMKASGIADDIIGLNIESCGESKAYSNLLYSDKFSRRNGGRLRDRDLKKYQHLKDGGWWCGAGEDLLNLGEQSLWGCFKPDKPRRDWTKPDKNKRIKYETPPKEPTSVFALNVPPRIAAQILGSYGFDPEANQTFWRFVIDNTVVPIVITEGAKKAAALLSNGYLVIALPGVYNGYRSIKDANGKVIKRDLTPELKAIAGKDREIYLAFDKDTKLSTKTGVDAATWQTGRLLKAEGCKVKILSWDNAKGKGCDDLIFKHGKEAFDEAFAKAVPLDVWKARQLSVLSYPANIQMNREYIGELEIPDWVRLLAIKSPKGTGKSTSIAPIGQRAIAQGKRLLLLTHRIQLTTALCKIFGVSYVSDLASTKLSKVPGMGLCIDSLHPNSQAHFDPSEWEGCTVVIDEVEQVLQHLLNSKTCQKKRISILKTLFSLLKVAERVIIADADLSDISLKYIKNIMGVNPFVIRNDYQLEGANYYRHPNKESVITKVDHLLAAGEKVLLLLAAQKAKSPFGTQNLEDWFREKFPELKILRIDAESLADKTHPAYGAITKINEILLDYDLVIASPSIETGISIDIRGHFKAVCAIANGVQSEASVRQALARVREPIDRHVFVSSFGFGTIGNGEVSPKALVASQNKQLKYNLKYLAQFASFDYLWHLEEDNEIENFQPDTLQCWAEIVCRHNAGMIDYAEQVFTNLKEEGHKIIDFDPEDTNGSTKRQVNQELTQKKNENYLKERIAIAEVDPFQKESSYQDSKKKRVKTKSERYRERNWEVGRKWGRENVTPEVIEMDDKKMYGKLRVLYYLTEGQKYFEQQLTGIAEIFLEEGAIFAPDFVRKLKAHKIEVLKALGLDRLLEDLDSGRQLRNSDEDLIKIKKKLCHPQTRRDLKSIGFGTFSEKKTPIQVIQQLLYNHLGIRTTCLDKDGKMNAQGKRDYTYGLEGWRQEMKPFFDYWLKVDQEKRLKQLEKKQVAPRPPTAQPLTQESNTIEHIFRQKVKTILSKLENHDPQDLRNYIRAMMGHPNWGQFATDVLAGASTRIRKLINQLTEELLACGVLV
ncbi:plasmid replication protein, CyRepA1 family [Moorena sp. SIO4G3]|uniref:plasmid replication protein, CyRepA1 family n=1 Tax=Moorena sp. SIO4G3 TaxID=2607821 RepID=UPI00142C1579|nr:plasmid replication protein, CyRepA1 family [Moorena sp. SIO4G3]NEO80656.1 DUF3854 domain-containing protein [Moorena sp. SIO4G3]